MGRMASSVIDTVAEHLNMANEMELFLSLRTSRCFCCEDERELGDGSSHLFADKPRPEHR